tara:strand:- start:1543 stop:2229 length:687 start_codon:yes stop_codon:yes gene_type:complete
MATVRFSDTLKGEIRSRAKAMFQDKISETIRNIPTHWADKVYECFFPANVRNTMASLPDYVLPKKEFIEISGWHNAPQDIVWQTGAYKHQTWKLDGGAIRLSFDKPVPWVDKFKESPTGFIQHYSHGTFDFTDPRWDWLKPEFKEYNRKVFEAISKQEKFLSSVNALMDTYTTLSPALKAWKPLWDLLPEEAKDRHRTIKERTVTKPEDLDIDFSSMTSAVALNKITK